LLTETGLQDNHVYELKIEAGATSTLKIEALCIGAEVQQCFINDVHESRRAAHVCRLTEIIGFFPPAYSCRYVGARSRLPAHL
jgi:hypothetical protein